MNFSNILFLIFLVFISSKSLKFQEEGTSSVYVYQNLILYAIPTTPQNCGYFQSMLSLYDIAYKEIKGLSNEACLKAIFDTATNKINSVIKNSQCIADSSSSSNSFGGSGGSGSGSPPVQPSNTPPLGISWMIGMTNTDHSMATNDTVSRWYGYYLDTRYVDKVPQDIFGLSYFIDYNRNVYKSVGNCDCRTKIPGALLSYLRVGASDSTVWGIDSNRSVYYLKDNAPNFIQVTGITLRYLDVNPKDGSVWGINDKYQVYFSSGIGGAFTEITGLAAKFLRVISNGNVFAISLDGSAYFKANSAAAWQLLDGPKGLTFIDVNNNGRIFAIRDNHSVFSKEYISGKWVDEGIKITTLRVVDDGTVWAIGDYDRRQENFQSGNLYFRDTSAKWKVVKNFDNQGLYSLWGPSNVPLRLGLL